MTSREKDIVIFLNIVYSTTASGVGAPKVNEKRSNKKIFVAIKLNITQFLI